MSSHRVTALERESQCVILLERKLYCVAALSVPEQIGLMEAFLAA